MAQELTDNERKGFELSEQAKEITQNPAVLRALADMERDIFELWRDTSLTVEQREELRRVQMTLQRFIATFDLYLQGGAQARYILGLEPEEKTFLQRVREYFNHGN